MRQLVVELNERSVLFEPVGLGLLVDWFEAAGGLAVADLVRNDLSLDILTLGVLGLRVPTLLALGGGN